MSDKKTQLELLQEIATLLEPISNLAKFNITQLNQQLAQQEEERKMIEEWNKKSPEQESIIEELKGIKDDLKKH